MDNAAFLLAEADQLRSFGAELNFAPWREVFAAAAAELVAGMPDGVPDPDQRTAARI